MALRRRTTQQRISNAAATFAVAASAVCAGMAPTPGYAMQQEQLQATEHAPQNSAQRAYSILSFIKFRLEGSGYVKNDAGYGPSRYGIVGSFHGLTPQEVYDLTPDQAMGILYKKYWLAIDANDLPRNMQLLAANAAIQFGPGRARGMIESADNNPVALHRIITETYHDIVQRNPAKHKDNLPGWMKRQNILANYLDLDVPAVSGPIDFSKAKKRHFAHSAPEKFVPFNPDAPYYWMGAAAGGLALWLSSIISKLTSRRRQQTAPLAPTPYHGAMDEEVMPTPAFTATPGAYQAPTPQNGLSLMEQNALQKVFAERAKEAGQNSWRVDYAQTSYVEIRHNQIAQYGAEGLEDLLKFAAHAYQNTCQIEGGSDEMRKKVAEVAQQMVNSGELSSGFTIYGIGTFRQQNGMPTRPGLRFASPFAGGPAPV